MNGHAAEAQTHTDTNSFLEMQFYLRSSNITLTQLTGFSIKWLICCKQTEQRDTLRGACTSIWNADNTQMGFLFLPWATELVSGCTLYDATHDVSLVGFQRAHCTWDSFPHVPALGGHKGWDSSVWNADPLVYCVEESAPSEPLSPVTTLTPLSTNPEPWERLYPIFFRIPSAMKSPKLLYGLMYHHDRVSPNKHFLPFFSSLGSDVKKRVPLLS